MTLRQWFSLCFFGALLLGSGSAAAEPLKIVTSFSILADMTRQVGGDAVAVTSIVGPDQDMHGFQLTPDDIKKLSGADLVIVNGLGFEGWLDRAIKGSGFKGQTAVATEGIKPMAAMDDGHDHGSTDPHAWQDLGNGQIYVQNVAKALGAALPEKQSVIAERAKAYAAQLKALDEDIKAEFSAIPAAERIVVTNHDAFGYFGAAYGVQFLAPLGLSSESEANAADIAKLQTQIRDKKIKALFLENKGNQKLLQQLAKDTGVTIGGTLYADSLSATTGPASSYLAMMRHNAMQIADALRPNKAQ